MCGLCLNVRTVPCGSAATKASPSIGMAASHAITPRARHCRIGNVYVLHESGIGELWIGTSNGMAVIRAGTGPCGRGSRKRDSRRWRRSISCPIRTAACGSPPTAACCTGAMAASCSSTTARVSPNNRLFRLLEDENGDFWASSNRGVFRISRPALTAVENGHPGAAAGGSLHPRRRPAQQPGQRGQRAGWLAHARWQAVVRHRQRRGRDRSGRRPPPARQGDHPGGRGRRGRWPRAAPAVVPRTAGRHAARGHPAHRLNQRAPERLRYRYRMVGFGTATGSRPTTASPTTWCTPTCHRASCASRCRR